MVDPQLWLHVQMSLGKILNPNCSQWPFHCRMNEWLSINILFHYLIIIVFIIVFKITFYYIWELLGCCIAPDEPVSTLHISLYVSVRMGKCGKLVN